MPATSYYFPDLDPNEVAPPCNIANQQVGQTANWLTNEGLIDALVGPESELNGAIHEWLDSL